jgi:sRNA-binding protein
MYLLRVIAGGNRYDLDGDVAGEITSSEIEYAKKVLSRIDAKKLKAAANYQRQHEERERTVVRQVKAKPRRNPIKPPASASSSQHRPPVRYLSRGELAALAKARRIGG